MPNITVPIADTYYSIALPVTKMVADEVRRICMIDEDTPIRLAGERGVTAQPNTRDMFRTGDSINYGETEKIYCTATETRRDNQLLSTPVRSREHTPFLYDNDLRISFRPVYMLHDVKLEFTYFAKSKNAAERWGSEMAMRIAESRGALQHTLVFDVVLNDPLLGLLSHLYTLREGIAAYGQTFKEWFDSIQVVPFYAAGAVDGDLNKITIQTQIHQAGVQGTFDEGDIPKETRNDESVLWEIQFTYNFSYSKPVAWFVAYPLMIHQQHISLDYFDPTPRYSVDDLDTNLSSKTHMALNRIRWSVSGRSPQPQDGLRYPYYDEWYIEHDYVEGSRPVINWMISLDVTKPQEILDLKDLPDMDFTKNMIQYFLSEPNTFTKLNRAFVKFTLYMGDQPMDESILELGEDLVLRSTRPLSLRHAYHVRMSFLTSSAKMSTTTIDRFLQHPLAALEMFQTLLPALDVEWAAAHAVEDGRLAEEYFEWVMWTLATKGIGFKERAKIPATRSVFLNPIPEVPPTIGHYETTRSYTPAGPKDPGSYSGRNTPASTPRLPVDTEFPFEMMTENDIREMNREKGYLAEPMTPSYSDKLPELPVLNNKRAMFTVQCLAIFARKTAR